MYCYCLDFFPIVRVAYCESCPSSQYHDCSHSEDISLQCRKLIM